MSYGGPPEGAAAPIPRSTPLPTEMSPNETRNLFLLAAYLVVVRIGWIFKTESVIIPAFLDHVAGAGWIRGFLPVVNRVGQSVPPVAFARSLKLMPSKKWALIGFSALMSLPFFALASIAYSYQFAPPEWLAAAFLLLYTLFVICLGLQAQVYGTLQGKLIPPQQRGRLMAMSSLSGSIPAVLLAWWLLPGWLDMPHDAGFAYIFAFTAVCFVLAGIPILALNEPADRHVDVQTHWFAPLRATWQIVRHDPKFRRLVPVAFLYSTVFMLFPHYQALAREKLHLAEANLMVWVIVQNIGTGIAGWMFGPLSDRRGERITLAALLFLAAVAPLLAVYLALVRPDLGVQYYWMVFAVLGTSPLSLKTLNNYVLEIGPTAEHPRYLSAIGLCLAVPFVLSPGIGLLVDWLGFGVVLTAGAMLLLLASALTFRLAETRHPPTNAN